jgi:hypothetical protein
MGMGSPEPNANLEGTQVTNLCYEETRVGNLCYEDAHRLTTCATENRNTPSLRGQRLEQFELHGAAGR